MELVVKMIALDCVSCVTNIVKVDKATGGHFHTYPELFEENLKLTISNAALLVPP